MARTGNFGGFEFDEEVFTDMMEEEQYWKSEILASGIVRNDSNIMNAIGSEGNVATIPMYVPFNAYDTDMAALNNDGLTDNTPIEIAGGKQTAMLIQRMKAFKAKDFTQELTSADPLGYIKKKIAGYYSQVWERELMNIAGTVLKLSDLSDHVLDLSDSSETSDANLITDTTLFDAEQQALGDMADKLGLFIMHSKIYAAYKKIGLVEYKKFVIGNAIEQEITLPTIDGKIVKVTDYHTVDTTGTVPVYSSYLFGEGAFLSADKKNYKNQYTTDYDPETAAGTEMFYTKQGKVLHPNGLSLSVDNIASESPTYDELGTSDNWSLKFNHKNVRIGVIKSNG